MTIKFEGGPVGGQIQKADAEFMKVALPKRMNVEISEGEYAVYVLVSTDKTSETVVYRYKE